MCRRLKGSHGQNEQQDIVQHTQILEPGRHGFEVWLNDLGNLLNHSASQFCHCKVGIAIPTLLLKSCEIPYTKSNFVFHAQNFSF